MSSYKLIKPVFDENIEYFKRQQFVRRQSNERVSFNSLKPHHLLLTSKGIKL